MLPEISSGIPDLPSEYENLEFIFVVIGFTVVLFVEKLILQKVEGNSQKRMRKLIEKEQILEDVEKNIEHMLTQEITREDLDEDALKEIAQKLIILNEQEEEFKEKISRYKKKIQYHVSKDLTRFRSYTYFIYHIFVGFILVDLLRIEFIAGIFFFIFAWFISFVLERREPRSMFSDIEIYQLELDESIKTKLFLGSGSLIGSIIAIMISTFVAVPISVVFILFSIIAGVMLLYMIREIIPEKEKGNIYYFIIGLVGFTIFVIIVELLTHFITLI